MPTAPAKKTWRIVPHTGEQFDLLAETYAYDKATGQHCFKNGEDFVATLYNVSVIDKAAVPTASN